MAAREVRFLRFRVTPREREAVGRSQVVISGLLVDRDVEGVTVSSLLRAPSPIHGGVVEFGTP